MNLAVIQSVALARSALADLLRQPVVLLIMLASLEMTALLPSLVIFDFGESGKLVRDGALALNLVAGMVLACHGASVTLHREIRRGTAATVLSKPVSRAAFFLSKYAAIAMLLGLFSALSAAVALLSMRAGMTKYAVDWWAEGPKHAALALALVGAAVDHYRTGRAFPGRVLAWLLPALALAVAIGAWIGPTGTLAPRGVTWLPWRLIPPLALNLLALLVLAGVAISLATRLPPLQTHVACAVLLFIGLIADYLAAAWPAPWVQAVLALIPNWQDFWRADALDNNGTIPWRYVARCGLYAGLYLTGCLGLGFMVFRKVEIR